MENKRVFYVTPCEKRFFEFLFLKKIKTNPYTGDMKHVSEERVAIPETAEGYLKNWGCDFCEKDESLYDDMVNHFVFSGFITPVSRNEKKGNKIAPEDSFKPYKIDKKERDCFFIEVEKKDNIGLSDEYLEIINKIEQENTKGTISKKLLLEITNKDLEIIKNLQNYGVILEADDDDYHVVNSFFRKVVIKPLKTKETEKLDEKIIKITERQIVLHVLPSEKKIIESLVKNFLDSDDMVIKVEKTPDKGSIPSDYDRVINNLLIDKIIAPHKPSLDTEREAYYSLLYDPKNIILVSIWKRKKRRMSAERFAVVQRIYQDNELFLLPHGAFDKATKKHGYPSDRDLSFKRKMFFGECGIFYKKPGKNESIRSAFNFLKVELVLDEKIKKDKMKIKKRSTKEKDAEQDKKIVLHVLPRERKIIEEILKNDNFRIDQNNKEQLVVAGKLIEDGVIREYDFFNKIELNYLPKNIILLDILERKREMVDHNLFKTIKDVYKDNSLPTVFFGELRQFLRGHGYVEDVEYKYKLFFKKYGIYFFDSKTGDSTRAAFNFLKVDIILGTSYAVKKQRYERIVATKKKKKALMSGPKEIATEMVTNLSDMSIDVVSKKIKENDMNKINNKKIVMYVTNSEEKMFNGLLKNKKANEVFDLYPSPSQSSLLVGYVPGQEDGDLLKKLVKDCIIEEMPGNKFRLLYNYNSIISINIGEKRKIKKIPSNRYEKINLIYEAAPNVLKTGEFAKLLQENDYYSIVKDMATAWNHFFRKYGLFYSKNKRGDKKSHSLKVSPSFRKCALVSSGVYSQKTSEEIAAQSKTLTTTDNVQQEFSMKVENEENKGGEDGWKIDDSTVLDKKIKNSSYEVLEFLQRAVESELSNRLDEIIKQREEELEALKKKSLKLKS